MQDGGREKILKEKVKITKEIFCKASCRNINFCI